MSISSVLPCVGRMLRAKGLLFALIAAMHVNAQDRYAGDRARMLEDIARLTHETRTETGRAALSERVLDALRRVPRHRLVPRGEEGNAYRNHPLAIGSGQTISQPFIVALMTDLLSVQPGDKVLEVGTGSGYQAATLAELGAKVYSIEILASLGREAAARLKEIGYTSIEARIGDGYGGWPEQAPFDGIIVTAAARTVPTPLLDQLKPGGRLVIPLGESGGAQTLYLIQKQADGKTTRRHILGVRFVPLTGEGQAQSSNR